MRFTVPGVPFGKQRPRTINKGGYAQTYTPNETVIYENLVKMCYIAKSFPKFDDKDELRAEITAYYSIPKSASKKKRAAMIEGKIRPTKKPDADNIAKAICDALNGVAYRDDSSIVELLVKKYYSEEPRVEVNLTKI